MLVFLVAVVLGGDSPKKKEKKSKTILDYPDPK
jgi:hypothetical protein